MSANGKPRIVATYDYRDEAGQLLYQSVRYEPGFDGEKKTFRQRRPNGPNRWKSGLGDVRRVLYRLPELLAAGLDRPVFVPEGEKDVDNLRAAGCVATTNAMGAGKWQTEYNEALRDRHVIILPDNDDPGRKHAQTVARALKGVAASVKVVELPGLPEKGDVSNWLQMGGNDKTALLNLVQAAPAWRMAAANGAAAGGPAAAASAAAPKAKQPTQAEVLLELAEVHDYFHSDDGRTYAVVQVAHGTGSHREVLPIRSVAFRQVLARDYYRATGKAASHGVLQNLLETLGARAQYDGDCREVGIRVMQAEGRTYLDLGDPSWHAVEISPDGWCIVDCPPVHFRRGRGMLPLPLPERGGSLDELRSLLNVGSDDDWRLLVAWAVQALTPTGPYPVLCLHGEQGSAKSCTSRMLRGLIDPNQAPLRSAPREDRDLVIAANNSWLLALDNLSDLPPWLSDALCRLATGGGYTTRELYSDSEETIFDVQRPTLLNGIEELTSRPDLLDRAVMLTLPALDEEHRLPEREVWARYDAIRPRVLGALLDAAAGALRHRGAVRLPKLPRMADFALLGEAVGRTLGWPEGAFTTAYGGNRDEQTSSALDSCIIFPALRIVVPTAEPWEGTATDLLEQLTHKAGDRAKAKGWPGSARALAGMLRRLAPTLRRAGLTVEFDRGHGRARQRLVRIRATPENGDNLPSAPSVPPATAGNPCPGRTQADAANGPTDDGQTLPSNRGPQAECGADGADGADAGPRAYSTSTEHGDAWEG